MAKVYGIQEPPPFYSRQSGKAVEKDLSSAHRYGAVTFLLNRTDRISATPGQCKRKIEKALENYEQGDYLFFPGGDFTGLILAGAVLRSMGFKEVLWLKWEKERDTQGKPLSGGFYTPITLPI